MKRLVIFGIKNFALIVHYLFSSDSDYTVVGFTVDREYLDQATFKGLPIVPFDEIEDHFPPETHDMFVAIGIGKLNTLRSQKVEEVEAKGYRVTSFISSRATVSGDLQIGPNTMIMEHVFLHPYVHIGRNSILWGLTTVALLCHIGDHCWIVSASFGECCTIGNNTFVGLNATIAPGCTIGHSNVIGAGALITQSSQDYAVFKGHASLPSKVPSTRLRNF